MAGLFALISTIIKILLQHTHEEKVTNHYHRYIHKLLFLLMTLVMVLKIHQNS